MSSRTRMISLAYPGRTASSVMPIACDAASCPHITAADRSATSWGDGSASSPIGGGFRYVRPKVIRNAIPQRIQVGQRVEYAGDPAPAEFFAPLDRPARVVHAEPHRGVDVRRTRDAGLDSVGAEGREHSDC